eukprot:TRINITY_DN3338_c0_g1_i1.p1 TRINITY_DN3338_c0_g1~~TRINITY_DN3338_c0_g1_i1.p1  ORF type:complete len:136 (+),score=32.89 TRINITY_DN3338_c0_g1_i1:111-518(+)
MTLDVEGYPRIKETTFKEYGRVARQSLEEPAGYINLRKFPFGERVRAIIAAQKGYAPTNVENAAPKLHVPPRITFYPREWLRYGGYGSVRPLSAVKTLAVALTISFSFTYYVAGQLEKRREQVGIPNPHLAKNDE